MSGPPRSQSRLQRWGNAAVNLLLRSPLHRALSGRLLTITVVGRKTGREYTFPVGYVEHDGALLVGTGATWRHNLRVGAPVTIRLRGRDRQADHEVITDQARAAGLYRAILRHNPVHGRFVGVGIEPDGSANTADLKRALANGAAVVRLRPR